ncbi:MAG: putative phosphoribosyl transferase [Chloroflexi bacterium]|jgi:putative phosphoribosyl transferase|nr:putative phosphoribosyl transferase [Chloroflexota bacterium]
MPDANRSGPVVPYANREAAGRYLATLLSHYAHQPNVIVLALPRGGVPVASEVAHALGAPLDVFLVRKLGVPGHEELAMGAIASGDVIVLNQELIEALHLQTDTIANVAMAERAELLRRELAYRDGRPPPVVKGRIVILVDDGLATGATMRAAARALRSQEPSRLVIAVPVAAPDTCAELRNEADEVICAVTPEPFMAVGYWYEDFSQVTDEEVRDLLARTARERAQAGTG